MRRREFIALLGGTAVAWPMASRAQQRAKPPRIGFLGLAFERTAGEWLRAGLRDLGYIEGTNIIIEWQWAQNVDELPALAAELVRMDVDVIFAPSSTFVEAASRRPRRFPSCSRFMPTQWAWDTSPVSRGRAGTSRARRCCLPSSLPRDWR
jgi:putative ABC transport system substrate-binding protein